MASSSINEIVPCQQVPEYATDIKSFQDTGSEHNRATLLHHLMSSVVQHVHVDTQQRENLQQTHSTDLKRDHFVIV